VVEETDPIDSDMIRLLIGENPKRGKSRDRFSLYRDGMTVAEYLDAVNAQLGQAEARKCMGDLRWDSDPHRAFIHVERQGKVVALRRPGSYARGGRAVRRRISAASPPSGASRRNSPLSYRGKITQLEIVNTPLSVLDESLVQSYYRNFLGYGNPRAKFWFIGKEDGGDKELNRVQTRLAVWDRRGRKSLEDCPEYHRAIGEARWHEGRPKIQHSWNAFIRIRLATENVGFESLDEKEAEEAVRRYQQKNLGTHKGSDCVVDLLPFPMHHWFTGKLSNRPEFEKWIIPARLEGIRALLDQNQSASVIFGNSTEKYLKYWSKIAGTPLEKTDDVSSLVWFARRGEKTFIAIPHPIYRAKLKMWYQAARLLRENLR
jgi:hypothetical protein